MLEATVNPLKLRQSHNDSSTGREAAIQCWPNESGYVDNGVGERVGGASFQGGGGREYPSVLYGG